MTEPVEVLARLAHDVDDEFERRRPAALVTWSWVEHAADRVWATAGTNADREAVVGLLCAVGNFKRQTPISLGTPSRPHRSSRPSASIRLIGLNPDVTVDERPQSVESLTQVKGIGTATATAALSALFPDAHAIMDSRSAPVAAAWARALNLDIAGPHRDDGARASVSDAGYVGWYHSMVHALAAEVGVGIRHLERVCFLAEVKTSGYPSWGVFADELVTKGLNGWSGL